MRKKVFMKAVPYSNFILNLQRAVRDRVGKERVELL